MFSLESGWGVLVPVIVALCLGVVFVVRVALGPRPRRRRATHVAVLRLSGGRPAGRGNRP